MGSHLSDSGFCTLRRKDACIASCVNCSRHQTIAALLLLMAFPTGKRRKKERAHEDSLEHRNSVVAWLARSAAAETIDKGLAEQFVTQKAYWREVLKRVVAVIKLLAERGLALRGNDDLFGSPRNGNFLGILEVIAEFDPFLSDHIARHGNKGKGHPSYLSKSICDDFVDMMGQTVRKRVVEEVQRAKYYSLIVDSTPDIAHVDQLSVVLRYCLEGNVYERFLKFVPIESHTGEYLASTVLCLLEENGISLDNCRGQSYDNASNMSGKYKGLQAHIKDKNPLAVYVPCCAHSLNLVGAWSVDCCVEAVKFFSLTQKLYVFFSASPKRWSCFLNSLDHGGQPSVLKSLSNTRWSRHADSCKQIVANFGCIKTCLHTLAYGEAETCDTRIEAQSLLKKLSKLETAFMATLWLEVLERFDKANVALQKPGLDLSTAVNLMSSLEGFVRSLRSQFQAFEERAKALSVNKSYQCERTRSISTEDNRTCGSKKFEIETFNVVIDNLSTALQARKSAYTTLCERFQCLALLREAHGDDLINQASGLVEAYKGDLDSTFPAELVQFFHYLESSSCHDRRASSLLKMLEEKDIVCVFPNVSIALRLYLTIPATNCETERSFSKLSLIKNCLRSTLGERKLNSLAIMSIERDLLRDISFDEAINDFASLKSRKIPF